MLERQDAQHRDSNGNTLEAYADRFDLEVFVGFDHIGRAVFWANDDVQRVLLNSRGNVQDIEVVPSYGRTPYEHVVEAVRRHGEWWFVAV